MEETFDQASCEMWPPIRPIISFSRTPLSRFACLVRTLFFDWLNINELLWQLAPETHARREPKTAEGDDRKDEETSEGINAADGEASKGIGRSAGKSKA